MTPTPLSPNGPSLSPVVAGAWRLHSWNWTAQERLRWIEQCIDLGISSFDHADVYGGYTTEDLFGEAIALQPAIRNRIQLVTKCGIKLLAPARPAHKVKSYDTSAAHITASVDNSLRALHTDHLDLLLIHRPDALLDADEVATTFEALRAAGKVLHFGVSNFTPSQFALLNDRIPLATNQIELHPLHRSPLHDGTLDQAQQLRRRPMIWSPLAGGRLVQAGHWLNGDASDAKRVRSLLDEMAAQRGVSAATLAFAWLIRHPAKPVPIVGSRRIEAMQEAVTALTTPLSAEDWYAIWQAGAGHEVA